MCDVAVQAREAIMKDPRMKEDYTQMHVGQVYLRPKTADERAEEERSQRWGGGSRAAGKEAGRQHVHCLV